MEAERPVEREVEDEETLVAGWEPAANHTGGSPSGERVVRVSRLAQTVTRCPWCHDFFEVAREDQCVCSVCGAAHHRACWKECGACATCRDRLYRRAAPGARRFARGRRAGALVLVLALAVLAANPFYLPPLVEKLVYHIGKRAPEEAKNAPADSLDLGENPAETLRRMRADYEAEAERTKRELQEARARAEDAAKAQVAAAELQAKAAEKEETTWRTSLEEGARTHDTSRFVDRIADVNAYWERSRLQDPSTVGMTDDEIERMEERLERKLQPRWARND